MSPDVFVEFITYAHQLAFRRNPAKHELEAFVARHANGGISPARVLELLLTSKEYIARQRVQSTFPIGHYHSPVVDPETVADYVKREDATLAEDIAGIPIDVPGMRQVWLDHLDFNVKCAFTAKPNGINRYCYEGGPFPEGDGVTLRMMFAKLRPRRVVEIGSGYSSACMLDSADELGLEDFQLTCIEPFPSRLRSILRPEDASRVTVIESMVQNVAPQIVDQLDRNDILFIDSTHVLKTGSDVHYEFFHLMPRLRPGVIVHVHDIRFPFEYPKEWIFDRNYSWNEIYALRALLMHQSRYRVMYWNSLLRRVYAKEMHHEQRLVSGNPGGSIWLECTGD